MTYDDLYKLVVRYWVIIQGPSGRDYVEAVGLPHAIENLAVELWSRRAAENKETETIRHQVLSLRNKGSFDLDHKQENE